MSYYAVYKGLNTGIFYYWNECKKNVIGYNGSIFKKFKNKKDAVFFCKNGYIHNESSKKINKTNITFKKDISKESNKSNELNKFEKLDESKKYNDNKIIKVYTDGSCINNGKKNAKAAIGIYFGDNDNRNVSKRIKGKQTNNTAELKAILKVSKILKDELKKNYKIVIFTDSQYSIKCLTTFGKKQDDINWSRDICNKKLVKKVYETFKNYSNVEFKHIRAHTNNKDIDSIGNSNADTLAYNALIKNINTNNEINIEENKENKNEKNDNKKKKNKKIYIYDMCKDREEKCNKEKKIELLRGKWNKNKKKWYINNPLIYENNYLFSKEDIR